jgi:hypothetical protein
VIDAILAGTRHSLPVGEGRLELPITCSQNRWPSRWPTPREIWTDVGKDKSFLYRLWIGVAPPNHARSDARPEFIYLSARC